MNYNVFFKTLGCAKNQVDTEVMIGILNNNNYFVTENPEEAHVIVVNTCGFIESAKEAVNMLGEQCRMMTHRKSRTFARERLIAWNGRRKLEFRRGMARAIIVNEVI